MSELEDALLAAHAAGDGAALVEIYQQAAAEVTDTNAKAFLLTHAHIFAMEVNHPDAPALRAALVAMERERPLPPPRAPKR